MSLLDFYKYDYVNNSWDKILDYQVDYARSDAFSFSIGTYGYAVGGKNIFGTYTNNTFRFNAVTETWEDINVNLPTTIRTKINGFTTPTYAFIDGYKFDPVVGTWMNSTISGEMLYVKNQNSYYSVPKTTEDFIYKYDANFQNKTPIYADPDYQKVKNPVACNDNNYLYIANGGVSNEYKIYDVKVDSDTSVYKYYYDYDTGGSRLLGQAYQYKEFIKKYNHSFTCKLKYYTNDLSKNTLYDKNNLDNNFNILANTLNTYNINMDKSILLLTSGNYSYIYGEDSYTSSPEIYSTNYIVRPDYYYTNYNRNGIPSYREIITPTTLYTSSDFISVPSTTNINDVNINSLSEYTVSSYSYELGYTSEEYHLIFASLYSHWSLFKGYKVIMDSKYYFHDSYPVIPSYVKEYVVNNPNPTTSVYINNNRLITNINNTIHTESYKLDLFKIVTNLGFGIDQYDAYYDNFNNSYFDNIYSNVARYRLKTPLTLDGLIVKINYNYYKPAVYIDHPYVPPFTVVPPFETKVVEQSNYVHSLISATVIPYNTNIRFVDSSNTLNYATSMSVILNKYNLDFYDFTCDNKSFLYFNDDQTVYNIGTYGATRIGQFTGVSRSNPVIFSVGTTVYFGFGYNSNYAQLGQYYLDPDKTNYYGYKVIPTSSEPSYSYFIESGCGLADTELYLLSGSKNIIAGGKTINWSRLKNNYTIIPASNHVKDSYITAYPNDNINYISYDDSGNALTVNSIDRIVANRGENIDVLATATFPNDNFYPAVDSIQVVNNNPVTNVVYSNIPELVLDGSYDCTVATISLLLNYFSPFAVETLEYKDVSIDNSTWKTYISNGTSSNGLFNFVYNSEYPYHKHQFTFRSKSGDNYSAEVTTEPILVDKTAPVIRYYPALHNTGTTTFVGKYFKDNLYIYDAESSFISVKGCVGTIATPTTSDYISLYQETIPYLASSRNLSPGKLNDYFSFTPSVSSTGKYYVNYLVESAAGITSSYSYKLYADCSVSDSIAPTGRFNTPSVINNINNLLGSFRVLTATISDNVALRDVQLCYNKDGGAYSDYVNILPTTSFSYIAKPTAANVNVIKYDFIKTNVLDDSIFNIKLKMTDSSLNSGEIVATVCCNVNGPKASISNTLPIVMSNLASVVNLNVYFTDIFGVASAGCMYSTASSYISSYSITATSATSKSYTFKVGLPTAPGFYTINLDAWDGYGLKSTNVVNLQKTKPSHTYVVNGITIYRTDTLNN